jgi:hypothetical protein
MPTPAANERECRREFLRASVRYTLLMALAGACFKLGFAGRNAPQDAACRRKFVCGECPQVARCELPEAGRFRQRNQEAG